jgi:UDP-2-acetamido-3-amino-2,3-dideoxy-glucuronate N-acetyltransferase
VGCGYWGKNLLRNLADLDALSLLCDADASLLGERAAAYPGLATTIDFEEVLNSDVDAVVIAAPAALHYSHARAVLEAGKDVFVEKPLALTLADGAALVDLAAERGAVLMVGHILQYHPAVERLTRIVRDGELGQVRYIYSNRLNLGKVRQEENILWSFAPHDIAVICDLAGASPTGVGASGGTYLQPGVMDVTVTNLEFADGLRSHIFVSWLHPFKEQKLVVIGDRRMAVFDDTAVTAKLRIFDKGIEWHDGLPVPRESSETVVTVPDGEPLRLEVEHFLECVRTRRRPKTDGESALRVLAVLEAAQRSLESGGASIKVNLNSETGSSGRPDALPSAHTGGSSALGTTAHNSEVGHVANGKTDDSQKVFVHPTAVVDLPATIGAGTRIWHFSHVMTGTSIGSDCNLGQNVFVQTGATVGNNVKIQNNVSVYTGVEIGDDAFLGPSMVFTNVRNPRSHVSRRHAFETTKVGRGASVGANATIVCGTTLGAYSFVGAGAVVTRDVPDFAVVVGAPARISGWMCQCGETLDFGLAPGAPTNGDSDESATGADHHSLERAECVACGSRYSKTGRLVALDDPSSVADGTFASHASGEQRT